MPNTEVETVANMCPTTPVIVLVGPPGAGKSSIGRRLARALSLTLVDSDHIIEQSQQKSCGQVFTELGEPAFRALEEEAVATALKSGGVVSLGGGAVLSAATRAQLLNHTVVWIDVSAEEGFRRTRNEDSRPVLQAEDPRAHYRRLLESREDYYREVSDYRVRSDEKTPPGLVAEILGFLETI
ncbi:shikimate kinase [Corynebacterium doosanense]|uniref:shikimate kinase n=1 Tax=Corynebacterium doosanense TaxID=1121358 RepID=UPI0009DAA5D0